jgi:hypothetical protein
MSCNIVTVIYTYILFQDYQNQKKILESTVRELNKVKKDHQKTISDYVYTENKKVSTELELYHAKELLTSIGRLTKKIDKVPGIHFDASSLPIEED